MKTRNTFSVLFYLKKGRINSKGEIPIYLRITVSKKSVNMSVYRSVNEKLWNQDSMRVVGNSKLAKELNDYMFSIKSSLYESYKYLRETNREVNPVLLRDMYFGIDIEERRGLIALFKEHNDEIAKLVGIDYSSITIRRYKTSCERLQQYLLHKYNKSEFYISDVNHSFVVGYENFLKTCKCTKNNKPISHNTSVKFMKQLKKIIRIARANGWIITDPFDKVIIREKKTDRGFLTDEDLKKIIEKEIETERLREVRDCFVFSCFTGLAHSDLANLKPDNIVIGTDGNKWIKINRKKTNTLSTIPVLGVTQKIIDKYKDHHYCLQKGCLLPVKSNQKMNEYLKEIGELSGVKKELTTHLARHTFATTITLNNDVPIETVSKMLGHTSLATTKIYARLLDNKVGKDMSKLNSIYTG